ncbi:hypothetical protein BC937DRAFT_92697 [Endogone sp. FLAS-F59071]|nr:hypothetical protein BC937DRAFT_92697 [Endogone sp. FLAS-F59071]|eukprot:RUS15253.1 hypothetical protein BC937DRAFT_92697 [Endogone sp. FLAS-F59071]
MFSTLLLLVLIVMYSSSANSTQNPGTLREERVREILLRRQQRQEQQDVKTTVPQPVLLIEGARFPAFDFVRREDDIVSNQNLGDMFTIAGRPIYLSEKAEDERQELESEEHTVRTAGSVWDCGIILAKYLEKQVASLALKDRRVIELGAGKSLPGLAAAVLGARVTLTDAPGVVPSIRRVVALNGLDVPSRRPSEGIVEMVEALDWVYRDLYLPTILPAYAPPFDFVICSDVVWVDPRPHARHAGAFCSPDALDARRRAPLRRARARGVRSRVRAGEGAGARGRVLEGDGRSVQGTKADGRVGFWIGESKGGAVAWLRDVEGSILLLPNDIYFLSMGSN